MAVYILFVGQAGSGKSSVAKQLASLVPGIALPFAKDVYRLASIVRGAPIDKSRREDRELLKLIGTTWGRECRPVPREIQSTLDLHKPKEWGTPHIWAKIFLSACRELPADVSVFNDDTRFVNELELAMGFMHFIPIFVSCTEDTRRQRLQERGDAYDPSATEHLSEEMTNFLSDRVLQDHVMPVVWNDSDATKPLAEWVCTRDRLRSLVMRSHANFELASALHWDSRRERALIALLRENLDQPAGNCHV